MNYKNFSSHRVGASKKSRVSKKKVFFYAVGVIFAFLVYGIIVLGSVRGLMLDIHRFSGKYLLILQNADELRAQGGFITSVGELNFTLGLPTVSLSNSYDFDHTTKGKKGEDFEKVVAPREIERIFAADKEYRGWTLRDANWKVDGGDAIEDILKLYALAVDKNVEDLGFDGVILVNSRFLERWLREMGGMSAGGRDFTAESLFLQLEEDVKKFDRHDAEAHKKNKSILKKLVRNMIWKTAVRPWSWGGAGRTIKNGLERKEILVFFEKPGLAKKYEKFGNILPDLERFAGKDDAAVSDIIGTVWTNLGGAKSDRYIRRSVERVVELDRNGDVTERVRVRAKHFGIEGFHSTMWRGNLRMVVPWGAKVLAFNGDFFEMPHIEKGEKVTTVSTMVYLTPGNEINMEFVFELPKNVMKDGKFVSYVRQQPGTDDFVRTIVKLSEQREITRAETQNGVLNALARENIGIFEGNLVRDERIELDFKSDVRTPYPVEQKTTAIDKVLVIFNEPLQKRAAENVENWKMWDADWDETTVTDEIVIVDAYYFDRGVTLTVAGMSVQPEERYKLLISPNVVDVAGNAVDEKVREVTVVQRLD